MGGLPICLNILGLSEYGIYIMVIRVKSGNFRHQEISDIHLQTVEIQMRRLLMSHLIRIFTVCLVNLFFIPIIKIRNKQCCCPNNPPVRTYMTLPYVKNPLESPYGIKELWDVETWHLGSTIPNPATATWLQINVPGIQCKYTGLRVVGGRYQPF